MANVKHIFSGAGDPNLLELDATIGVHHYCDDDTGDLWMSDTAGDWKLIYRGGTAGNIAVTEGAGEPLEDPLYPRIHLDTADKRAFIVVNSALDGYSWKEIQLVEGLP